MKKLSVKTHIFILQLIVILIPFLLISFNQYVSEKEDIEAEQMQVLRLKSEQVENIFQQYREEVRTYAILIANMNDLKSSVESLTNEVEWSYEDPQILNNYPSESYNFIQKDDFDVRFTNLSNQSKFIFNTLHKEHDYIGNLEIMNKNLVVIMRGHRDKRGDIKTDKLINDAIKGISSSGFLVSKRTGQPAIDGTAPVISENQIVGGVKVGMYITEKVSQDIERKTGIRLLSFDKNQLIMTSNFSKNMTFTNSIDSYEKFDVLRFPESNNSLGPIKIKDHIYDNFISLGLPYTQLYSEASNKNYAITILPIKNYDSEVIGAYMIALDNEEMMADLGDEFEKNLIGIAMIILLAIIVSLIFSHQIGHPLVNFRQQIKSMKNTDSVKHIKNIYGPQELLEMAYEFNSLVDTVSFQKKKNKKLEIISNIDGLTNLYNHRKFYQDLSLLYDESNLFSLIFIDLDNFKKINDAFGHTVGDTILREVSKILKKFDDDKIRGYRYGGEEFAILLKEVNKEDSYHIAEKIRLDIEASDLLKSLVSQLNVTVSSGVAEYPIDASSDSELVENADYAMYYSKKNGRNKSTLYSQNVKDYFYENSENTIQKNALINSVNLLSNALEARDQYTANHSKEVMRYSVMLGEKIGLTSLDVENLKHAAILHDNGKIGVSDKILLKKGKLTDLEFEEVKKHPSIGYNIINNLTTNEVIKKAILHHHENWNGSGYPKGLEGNKIPIMSRIIAVADSYQAMTSDRPYRKALKMEEAISQLVEYKSIKYDPNLVDQFIEILNDNHEVDLALNDNLFNSKILEVDNNYTKFNNKAYESTTYNVVHLDTNRNIKYANLSTQKLIGKPLDQIMNRPCFSVIIGSNKPCKHCKIDKLLADKSIEHCLNHEVLADGTSRDIMQIWIPLFDDNNDIESILEIAIDVVIES